MSKPIKKPAPRQNPEEDDSGIRTRKVRFTGDGFAFPSQEDKNGGRGKRSASGRDAIIVEGAPGQGNIKNRSENSITEMPEPKRGKKKSSPKKDAPKDKPAQPQPKKAPAKKESKPQAGNKATEVKEAKSAPKAEQSGQKKSTSNNRKKKSPDKQTIAPAAIPEPVSEALAVLPAEKTAGPAKGKKKRSKKEQRRSDALVEKLAENVPTGFEPTPAPVKEKPKKEKAPADTPKEKKDGQPKQNAGKPEKKKSQKTQKRREPTDHKQAAPKPTADLLPCRFSYSGRGFGFAVPIEPAHSLGEDIFISPKATMGAMSGDTVLVRVFRHPGHGHSAEGEVTEITERAVKTITGRLTVTRDYAAVKPDNDKLRVLAYVSPEDCAAAGAKNGDKVEILPIGEDYFHRAQSITVRRSKHDQAPFFDTQGRVAVIFGSAAGREANYAAILHSSGIRTEFPPYVKTAAANAAEQPLTKAGRVDLRDRIIFTIDGADAKDLDDAISLEKLENGDWQLGVHIADVSHYVPYEGCVEKEARARGTSVYFTDKVIPMLPEELSNGA